MVDLEADFGVPILSAHLDTTSYESYQRSSGRSWPDHHDPLGRVLLEQKRTRVSFSGPRQRRSGGQGHPQHARQQTGMFFAFNSRSHGDRRGNYDP